MREWNELYAARKTDEPGRKAAGPVARTMVDAGFAPEPVAA